MDHPVSLGVSLLLGGLVCGGVLLLMAMTQVGMGDKPVADLMVRAVPLAPPPPPKRKVIQRRDTLPMVLPTMNAARSNSPVVLETAPIEVPLDLSFDPSLVAVTGAVDFEVDIGMEAELALKTEFTFEDLDQQVRVIHTGGFTFTFPENMVRRGISTGEALLHIEIDEKGKARLLEVVSVNHRSFLPIAKRFVSRVRFSTPTVDGVPKLTTGHWPLVLNAPRKR